MNPLNIPIDKDKLVILIVSDNEGRVYLVCIYPLGNLESK